MTDTHPEEDREGPDCPKDPPFKKQFVPRAVLHCLADGKCGQKIEDTGPLKRMETIEDEATDRALAFIDKCHMEGNPWHRAAKDVGRSVIGTNR